MEETNPWQTLKTSTKYDNPWIRVDEADVINPSGGKGIYGTVHFKNKAIGIIAIDHEDHTWLVGQYRYALNRYSWEIPEGGGHHDKDPLLSAQRELLEETGLVANKWTLLFEMDVSNSVTDERAYLYLAEELTQHKAMPEDTEQLVVKRLPFESAWDMVQQGVITDSLSVATIQRVKLERLLSQGQ